MYPDYQSKFPELGFYGLPGHTRSPRDILKQAQDAEALGIGNIMISERPDYKEVSAICGAVAAVTSKMFIGSSATNLNKRHPTVTASMASTLHRLSEGRFALGLAKGVAAGWRARGMQPINYKSEREFIDLMRRLWSGETIRDYDGAVGKYPVLSLAQYLNEAMPILYVGFGPKSLEHAGRVYDGTHLHTFMNDKALSDSVARVRAGEVAAGRKSGEVKNWSVYATCCDVSEETYLRHIVARLASYLQIPGYGEMLVQINGWDPEVLRSFRESVAVRKVGGFIDSVATIAQLAEIERIIPQEWRPAAVGNARQCAEAWLTQFEAGADGIIVHASTPEEFAPVLAEYEKIRPVSLFAGRTNRPG
ncbi:MAG: TIGR03857 family LLM class F420-dependent oxidoreductase [Gammaproteobacteria bacterium]|nr:TIGR03857 family LLM class F420-dependent oxidoreductase [Gammaproteobacteria bacterium]|tara:strand:+ start:6304 stop:7392 length:1089 start_codon:yes stop_codon:yes gene_type:complete